MEILNVNLEPVLAAIGGQYLLRPDGLHGLSHWGRVLENGLRLAKRTGADLTVVALFAVFHDACRQNQGIDPGHGERGAEFASRFFSTSKPEGITSERLALLDEACRLHTEGLRDADITIQTCWDADRLDLARAGITPSPHRLCTGPAREQELIEWANIRSRTRYVPHFVEDEWAQWFKSGSSG
jgi:uncharacterized protein